MYVTGLHKQYYADNLSIITLRIPVMEVVVFLIFVTVIAFGGLWWRVILQFMFGISLNNAEQQQLSEEEWLEEQKRRGNR